MKTYTITFNNKETQSPVATIDMQGATLTAAINKAMRQIEKMKSVFRDTGYSDSHLCGLVVSNAKQIQ